MPKVTINDRTVEVAAGTNLVDAAIGPVQSLVKSFPEEIDLHLKERGCPYPHRRYFQNGA